MGYDVKEAGMRTFESNVLLNTKFLRVTIKLRLKNHPETPSWSWISPHEGTRTLGGGNVTVGHAYYYKQLNSKGTRIGYR